LRPLLAESGVSKTVLVQTRSSLAETKEFLEIAAATEFIAGVVGWVDLTAPDVASTIDEIRSGSTGRWLVGIRHQVHDEEDAAWLARKDVRRGLAAIEGAGLAYDLLVRPREMPAAISAVRAFPQIRFVVDHVGKPSISRQELEPWASQMAEIARFPNVACKLSGMVTEADWKTWTAADLVPYVRRVIGWFGEDRVMFGSDWPVCLLAVSYSQVCAAVRTALDGLGLSGSDRIFGANAIRIYGLKPTD
jgi:L-fuconolactonase